VTPDKLRLLFAGSIADDEMTHEWLDAIAENRRQRDVEDQQANLPAPDPARAVNCVPAIAVARRDFWSV